MTKQAVSKKISSSQKAANFIEKYDRKKNLVHFSQIINNDSEKDSENISGVFGNENLKNIIKLIFKKNRDSKIKGLKLFKDYLKETTNFDKEVKFWITIFNKNVMNDDIEIKTLIHSIQIFVVEKYNSELSKNTEEIVCAWFLSLFDTEYKISELAKRSFCLHFNDPTFCLKSHEFYSHNTKVINFLCSELNKLFSIEMKTINNEYTFDEIIKTVIKAAFYLSTNSLEMTEISDKLFDGKLFAICLKSNKLQNIVLCCLKNAAKNQINETHINKMIRFLIGIFKTNKKSDINLILEIIANINKNLNKSNEAIIKNLNEFFDIIIKSLNSDPDFQTISTLKFLTSNFDEIFLNASDETYFSLIEQIFSINTFLIENKKIKTDIFSLLFIILKYSMNSVKIPINSEELSEKTSQRCKNVFLKIYENIRKISFIDPKIAENIIPLFLETISKSSLDSFDFLISHIKTSFDQVFTLSIQTDPKNDKYIDDMIFYSIIFYHLQKKPVLHETIDIEWFVANRLTKIDEYLISQKERAPSISLFFCNMNLNPLCSESLDSDKIQRIIDILNSNIEIDFTKTITAKLVSSPALTNLQMAKIFENSTFEDTINFIDFSNDKNIKILISYIFGRLSAHPSETSNVNETIRKIFNKYFSNKFNFDSLINSLTPFLQKQDRFFILLWFNLIDLNFDISSFSEITQNWIILLITQKSEITLKENHIKIILKEVNWVLEWIYSKTREENPAILFFNFFSRIFKSHVFYSYITIDENFRTFLAGIFFEAENISEFISKCSQNFIDKYIMDSILVPQVSNFENSENDKNNKKLINKILLIQLFLEIIDFKCINLDSPDSISWILDFVFLNYIHTRNLNFLHKFAHFIKNDKIFEILCKKCEYNQIYCILLYHILRSDSIPAEKSMSMLTEYLSVNEIGSLTLDNLKILNIIVCLMSSLKDIEHITVLIQYYVIKGEDYTTTNLPSYLSVIRALINNLNTIHNKKSKKIREKVDEIQGILANFVQQSLTECLIFLKNPAIDGTDFLEFLAASTIRNVVLFDKLYNKSILTSIFDGFLKSLSERIKIKNIISYHSKLFLSEMCVLSESFLRKNSPYQISYQILNIESLHYTLTDSLYQNTCAEILKTVELKLGHENEVYYAFNEKIINKSWFEPSIFIEIDCEIDSQQSFLKYFKSLSYIRNNECDCLFIQGNENWRVSLNEVLRNFMKETIENFSNLMQNINKDKLYFKTLYLDEIKNKIVKCLINFCLFLEMLNKISDNYKWVVLVHSEIKNFLIEFFEKMIQFLNNQKVVEFRKFSFLDSYNFLADFMYFTMRWFSVEFPTPLSDIIGGMKKGFGREAKKFCQDNFCSLIVENEMKSCCGYFKNDETLKIVNQEEAQCLAVKFTSLEDELSFNLRISDSYPFEPVKVETIKKRAKTSEVLSLMRYMELYISTPKCYHIVDGLKFWKSQFEKRLNNVDKCYICYCVISSSDMTLPSSKCAVCRQKFHKHCLFQWFNNSLKKTCPLCRSNFY